MRVVTQGGEILSKSGNAVAQQGLAQQLDALLLWDAVDADTYEAGASGYGLTPATRVASVPDRGSWRKDLHIDGGAYGVTSAALNGGNASALPGPLWVPSSTRFNGRPAWFSDTIQTTGVIFFDNLHSMLSPQISQVETLDLPQPFWFFIVAAFPPGISGVECSAWDGDPAQPTINPSPNPTSPWNCACFNHDLTSGGILVSSIPGNLTGTFLLCGTCNTTSSSFTVVTRDSQGVPTQATVNGTMGSHGDDIDAIHFGWTHTSYVTAAGVGAGTIDLTAVVNTCLPMIGPNGA